MGLVVDHHFYQRIVPLFMLLLLLCGCVCRVNFVLSLYLSCMLQGVLKNLCLD